MSAGDGYVVKQQDGNLPVPLTQLVGREAAARDIDKLVSSRGRLVTLIGPGGVGKTSLAVEVASQLTTHGLGGKWFVDLAEIAHDVSVEHAVVTALGLPEVGHAPLVDVVAGFLHGRDALLVMDNCEHVVEGAAQLISRLLRSCPSLFVLATSRVPLRTEGEATFVVQPLDVPSQHDDYAAATPAFRLFVERAGLEEDITSDVESTAAIANVCRKVEGLPLAIELAASRCSVLSPAQISDGLEHGFAILGRGRRDAHPRHQALDASIAWSWNLLPDTAKTALSRLSVLAAPFPLDAAETVTALEPHALLDALTAITEGSLLQATTGPFGIRYRFLEPVRQFAYERLREATEVESCERRVVDWCAALTHRLRTDRHGADGAVAIACLEEALPHIRRALDTCAAGGLVTEGVRIIASSIYLWQRRHIVEGISRLRAFLESVEAGSSDEMTGGLVLADFCFLVGDLDASRRWASRVLAFADGREDHLVSGRAHNMLGWMAAQVADAADHFHAAITNSDISGDAETAIRARRGLTNIALASGHADEALVFSEQALARARQAGSPIELEWALFFAAVAAYDRAELDVAEPLLHEAATVGQAMEDELVFPFVNAWLSRIDARRGRLDDAIERAAAFVERCRERQMMFLLAAVLWALGLAKHEGSAPGTEVVELEQAQLLITQQGFPHLAAQAAAARANAAVHAGDVERGIAIAQEGLSLAEQPFGGAGRGLCELALGAARGISGDLGAALRITQDALASLLAAGDRIGAISALEQAARLMTHRAAEDAARLMGAAAAARVQLACPAPPVSLPGIEECRHVLSAALGSRFDSLVAEGALLTVEEAAGRVRRGRGRRGRPAAGWDSLTPSERAVVDLVARGMTNAAIAGRLVISVSTVKSHIGHVFGKLGLTNRAELVALATRHQDASQLR